MNQDDFIANLTHNKFRGAIRVKRNLSLTVNNIMDFNSENFDLD